VIIVATVVLGGLAGIGASVAATPVYTAKAKLYFSIGAGATGTDLNQGSTYAQAQMLSFAELATSPIVLAPVIDSLQLHTTTSDLAGAITATTPQGTVLLEISASSSTGAKAANIANAVAASLSSELDRLAPTSTGSKKALTVTVVTPATTPTSKSAPDTSRNILAGLVLGLIVGVLITVLRQRIERRIDGPDALAEVTNAPLLGSIGRRHRSPTQSNHEHPVLITEADRQLGATLLAALGPTPHFSVLVTSSVSREGTTVTALGLSLALGERRHRVLLIESNLRRPSIASRTGLPDGPGLAEALADPAYAAPLVSSLASIDVLVAGNASADPSVLLSSDGMATLLQKVQRDYDIVILDVAPVSVSADAAILGPLVTGTIVVADTTRVRAAQLASALDSLTAARIPVVGVVLNHVRRRMPHYSKRAGLAADSETATVGAASRAKHAWALEGDELVAASGASRDNASEGAAGETDEK
jgi:capsular exopolysaccharide synthesis family protein